jgi:hypothetical protein
MNTNFITNIVASVTVALVTNVETRVTRHWVVDINSAGTNGGIYAVVTGHFEDDKEPREKWVTTNVVERTIWSFNLSKGPEAIYGDRPVTNWTTHFELHNEWMKSATNSPAPSDSLFKLE